MEKKRFLFISKEALISDIAWQIVKEGHEAKYFIEHQKDREVADGFVQKVDNWEKEVGWADVIVFDDVLGHGTIADKLRKEGRNVIGGTPYTDMLEHDRAIGQEELRKSGVSIIPQWNFDSVDEAIDFVEQHPDKYVIKPSGEAQNMKRLLFVGEEEDGKDIVNVLKAYKKAWSNEIKNFQIQKRITGVEVAVGAFFYV